MKIQYFAHLRDSAGCKEEVWTQKTPILRDLISELCKKYGKSFEKWVLNEDGSLCEIAIILINGNDVRHKAYLDTQLSDEDIVSIFPPVAGG